MRLFLLVLFMVRLTLNRSAYTNGFYRCNCYNQLIMFSSIGRSPDRPFLLALVRVLTNQHSTSQLHQLYDPPLLY